MPSSIRLLPAVCVRKRQLVGVCVLGSGYFQLSLYQSPRKMLPVTNLTSPISPARTSSFILTYSGLKRFCCPICRILPLFSAAAIMRLASSTEVAMGFSERTLMP